MKVKCVVLGKSLCPFSTGSKKLWFSSKLLKIRFNWGRPPESLGYRHKKRNQDRLQGRWCILWPLCYGSSSETEWAMINLVGYRVLMTYYYMSSFHMTWMGIYNLVIQSKLTYKVDRCILPSPTQNKKLSITDLCTLHILYLVMVREKN